MASLFDKGQENLVEVRYLPNVSGPARQGGLGGGSDAWESFVPCQTSRRRPCFFPTAKTVPPPSMLCPSLTFSHSSCLRTSCKCLENVVILHKSAQLVRLLIRRSHALRDQDATLTVALGLVKSQALWSSTTARAETDVSLPSLFRGVMFSSCPTSAFVVAVKSGPSSF